MLSLSKTMRGAYSCALLLCLFLLWLATLSSSLHSSESSQPPMSLCVLSTASPLTDLELQKVSVYTRYELCSVDGKDNTTVSPTGKLHKFNNNLNGSDASSTSPPSLMNLFLSELLSIAPQSKDNTNDNISTANSGDSEITLHDDTIENTSNKYNKIDEKSVNNNDTVQQNEHEEIINSNKYANSSTNESRNDNVNNSDIVKAKDINKEFSQIIKEGKKKNTIKSVLRSFMGARFEKIISINDTNRVHVPLAITGSGVTALEFTALQKHTLGTIIQLRNHRYDSTVPMDNCAGVAVKIELRRNWEPELEQNKEHYNKFKISKSEKSDISSDTVNVSDRYANSLGMESDKSGRETVITKGKNNYINRKSMEWPTLLSKFNHWYSLLMETVSPLTHNHEKTRRNSSDSGSNSHILSLLFKRDWERYDDDTDAYLLQEQRSKADRLAEFDYTYRYIDHEDYWTNHDEPHASLTRTNYIQSNNIMRRMNMHEGYHVQTMSHKESKQHSLLSSTSAALESNEDNLPPVVDTGDAYGLKTFWNSIARMFDTSAFCEVLPNIAMRVSYVPVTEKYYFLIYTDAADYMSDDAMDIDGRPINPFTDIDSRYTCQMDFFVDQVPFSTQLRQQFFFGFALPYLIIVLPLPLFLWYASSIQELMENIDFTEWFWYLPYGMRDAIIAVVLLLTRKIHSYWIERNERNQQRELEEQHRRLMEGFEMHETHHAPNVTSTVTILNDVDDETTNNHDINKNNKMNDKHENREEDECKEKESEQLNEHDNCYANNGMDNTLVNSSEQEELHNRGEHHGNIEQTTNSNDELRKHNCTSTENITDKNDNSDDIGTLHFREGSDTSVEQKEKDPLLLHGDKMTLLSHKTNEMKFTITPTNHFGTSVPSQDVIVNPVQHRNEHNAHNNAHNALHELLEQEHEQEEEYNVSISNEQNKRERRRDHDILFAPLTNNNNNKSKSTSPQTTRETLSDDNNSNLQTNELKENSEKVENDNLIVFSTNTGNNNEDVDEDDEHGEKFCRICREDDSNEKLITPCACTGSVRYVHQSCLDHWRLESAKRNLRNVNRCEICKQPFTVGIRRSTLLWQSSKHFVKVGLLIVTSIISALLISFIAHGLFGFFSCIAFYHNVALGGMFTIEGMVLTFLVYYFLMFIVYFAHMIVLSWFRARPAVVEYFEEMNIYPPFYSIRTVCEVCVVSLVLLAQVIATGYILKVFLYFSSNIVWNWEISPIAGAVCFAMLILVGMYISINAPNVLRRCCGHRANRENVNVDDEQPNVHEQQQQHHEEQNGRQQVSSANNHQHQSQENNRSNNIIHNNTTTVDNNSNEMNDVAATLPAREVETERDTTSHDANTNTGDNISNVDDEQQQREISVVVSTSSIDHGDAKEGEITEMHAAPMSIEETLSIPAHLRIIRAYEYCPPKKVKRRKQ